MLGTHDVVEWDGDDGPIGGFAVEVGSVDAVGHRVVHGGTDFTRPVILDEEVEARLRGLVGLAPLHQPAALAAIAASRRALPGATHVACFDTAFHATLAPAAYVYALPAAWRDRWPLRRFGFHGLSHSYATRRVGQLAGVPVADLQIVSCHLGAGASLCAVRGGCSVDTTMGFTPLDGLVMATRAGAIDPGLVLWLTQSAGLSGADVQEGLEMHSGLVGLAGTADMRAVVDRGASGDPAAVLAFEVYAHRLRRELGAMKAALGAFRRLCVHRGCGRALRRRSCRLRAGCGSRGQRPLLGRRRDQRPGRAGAHVRGDRARRPRDRPGRPPFTGLSSTPGPGRIRR